MSGQNDDRAWTPEQVDPEDDAPTYQVDEDREPTRTETATETMSGDTGPSGDADTGTGGTGMEEPSSDGTGGMTGLTGTTSDETRS